MKATAIALILLGSVVLVRADQMIESVQQVLKDQGFYYGEITGEKNANLTAAIRRFQIRNGLQINGELNSETLRSLRIGSSASAQPVAKAAPSPTPGASEQGDEKGDQSSRETAGVAPAPVQPFGNAPQDRQLYPSMPMTPGPSGRGSLLEHSTKPPRPVCNATPVSAQIALARRGLYRGEIDGVYGPPWNFVACVSGASRTSGHRPVRFGDACRARVKRHGHAHRSSIRSGSVCLAPPSHPCVGSGFLD
jgi:hypothetical protein